MFNAEEQKIDEDEDEDEDQDELTVLTNLHVGTAATVVVVPPLIVSRKNIRR